MRTDRRLDPIDGLRAILALYVVQRHAEVFFWRVTESHAAKRLSPWTLLHYAHFAVDLFIVISGFCLFLPVVLAAGEVRGGATAFFKRRALRILPPYYAALGGSIAALWLTGQTHTITGANSATVWHHLLLVHDGLSPFAINSALWSVAVECHLCVLFPLLALSFTRLGAAVTLAATTLLAGGLYALLLRYPSYRVITPQYGILFVLGMLGASIYASPRWVEAQRIAWGAVAAALIPAMMAVHHFAPPHLVDRLLGVEDVLVGIGAMALLLAASRPGLLARALSARPLVFIGKFSYSIYLVHIPILELLARFPASRASAADASGWTKLLGMSALVCVATGGAYAFYWAFELPFVRLLQARRVGSTDVPAKTA